MNIYIHLNSLFYCYKLLFLLEVTNYPSYQIRERSSDAQTMLQCTIYNKPTKVKANITTVLEHAGKAHLHVK
jgi:hypothetical protein